MSSRDDGYPILRKIGFAIVAFAVGLQFAVFFIFISISWGAFIIPFLVLLSISPLILLDYISRRGSPKADTPAKPDKSGDDI